VPRLYDTEPERDLRITFKVLNGTPGSCPVTTPVVFCRFREENAIFHQKSPCSVSCLREYLELFGISPVPVRKLLTEDEKRCQTFR
jgi:hypothetical protein